MKEDSEEREENEPAGAGKGAVLGAGMGMIFGAALGNPGAGLVLGAGLGLILRSVSDRTRKG